MDVRYQFFLSSTFDDLREERQQVIQAILELEHIPVGMEIFPSADEAPWEIVKRTIEQSDYYVVLSAGRYGSTFQDGLSFTEREFDLAVDLNVPVIGFLAKSPNDLPAAKREDDPERRARLKGFQDKTRQRHVRTWSSVDELGLQASKAIIYATRTIPRTGWVRADKARSGADLERIDELRSESDKLKKDLRSSKGEVKKLNELIRKTVLPGEDREPALLAQGNDPCRIAVRYTLNGERVARDLTISWDECFRLIGPKMYQIIHFGDHQNNYSFEVPLRSHLRNMTEITGSNTVSYERSEIDKLMFQFKQLGYVYIATAKDGRSGWTLTPSGEEHLTDLLTVKKDAL